jgi:hypothetical protein
VICGVLVAAGGVAGLISIVDDRRSDAVLRNRLVVAPILLLAGS